MILFKCKIQVYCEAEGLQPRYSLLVFHSIEIVIYSVFDVFLSGLFKPDVTCQLLDLSLLPVLAVAGAARNCCQMWPRLVEFVTDSVDQSDTQRTCALIRVTVRNSFYFLKALPSLCESIGSEVSSCYFVIIAM